MYKAQGLKSLVPFSLDIAGNQSQGSENRALNDWGALYSVGHHVRGDS